MLHELTKLDFLKMRYIFTFAAKKGMDRIGFTKFIWELSRFKPLETESGDEVVLDDIQEVSFLLSSSFLFFLKK